MRISASYTWKLAAPPWMQILLLGGLLCIQAANHEDLAHRLEHGRDSASLRGRNTVTTELVQRALRSFAERLSVAHRNGAPLSDTIASIELPPLCEVNDAADVQGKEALEKIHDCVVQLQRFKQDALTKANLSKRNNEGYVGQYAKVVTMLTELADQAPWEAAYAQDQQTTYAKLKGRLERVVANSIKQLSGQT
mmetsp:Transcript_76076/g.138599  ORF Transcript_76076/g.138599 Transcript_76076/m.138599 type:complete len:194 (-) Transcript_76076:55-636(-)